MEIHDVALSRIDTDFGRFRFIDPRAQSRMTASIRSQGQLTPVLAGRTTGTCSLLIDGFKRYRAMESLQVKTIRVHEVRKHIRGLKIMLLVSGNAQTMPAYRHIEEALVLHSLHREDGLQQQEIALMCNRDRSWVCRRIGLIEKLSDEVLEQLRLGLVSIAVSRELMRLPRGNQREALRAITENHLTSRQSSVLIETLLTSTKRRQEKLLHNPRVLFDSCSQPPIDCGLYTPTVTALRRNMDMLFSRVAHHGVGNLTTEQSEKLHSILTGVQRQCASCIGSLQSGGGFFER